MRRLLLIAMLGLALAPGQALAVTVATLTISPTSITRLGNQTIYDLDIYATSTTSQQIKGVEVAFNISGPANGPLISAVSFDVAGAAFQNAALLIDFTGPAASNVPLSGSYGAGPVTTAVTLSTTPTLLAQVAISTTDIPGASGTWTFNFSDTGGNATHLFDGSGNSLGPSQGLAEASQNINISAVPEPSTWASLIGCGLMGSLGLLWQRRKKQRLAAAKAKKAEGGPPAVQAPVRRLVRMAPKPLGPAFPPPSSVVIIRRKPRD